MKALSEGAMMKAAADSDSRYFLQRILPAIASVDAASAEDETKVDEGVSTATRVLEDTKMSLTCRLTLTQHVFTLSRPVLQIACSEAHVLFATDLELFAFGHGPHGQLGLGRHVLSVLHPTKIALSTKETPRCIATSHEHSCVVTSPHGTVYSFGHAKYARLGFDTGNDNNVYEPTVVEGLLGTGQLLPNGTTTGIDYVACGKWHSIAISAQTNDVYGWGWNKFAQLGSNTSSLLEHKDSMIGFPQRLSFLDDILGEEVDETNRICHLTAGTRYSAILTKGSKLVIM